MRKTAPIRAITEADVLEAKTLAWCAEKFPTVDAHETWETFVDYCNTHGTMYSSFQAGFRNWVRRGVREFSGRGIVYLQGIAADPKWVPILTEVAPYGFRKPLAHETPQSYRTEFENWKRAQNRSSVLKFDVLKRM